MTALSPSTLIVGLGGNTGGDPALLQRFRRAAEALATWGAVTASAVYRTAPWGGRAQDDFLNAALRIATAEPPPLPAEIIEAVQEIERLLGRAREREERWGPRAIDIDVLLWGARPLVWRGPPALVVPHPRLIERRFAIDPVIDLVGEAVVVPGDGRTLGAIRAALGDQGVALTDLVI